MRSFISAVPPNLPAELDRHGRRSRKRRRSRRFLHHGAEYSRVLGQTALAQRRHHATCAWPVYRQHHIADHERPPDPPVLDKPLRTLRWARSRSSVGTGDLESARRCQGSQAVECRRRYEVNRGAVEERARRECDVEDLVALGKPIVVGPVTLQPSLHRQPNGTSCTERPTTAESPGSTSVWSVMTDSPSGSVIRAGGSDPASRGAQQTRPGKSNKPGQRRGFLARLPCRSPGQPRHALGLRVVLRSVTSVALSSSPIMDLTGYLQIATTRAPRVSLVCCHCRQPSVADGVVSSPCIVTLAAPCVIRVVFSLKYTPRPAFDVPRKLGRQM